ncbi:uncharacterized protein LOC127832638 isoform X8 [Dreissena polymorpha]|uniref:uncharacterized protein LOC127832638 isoform X8 n=1 Tax=Dreissena polymorpha TaxID=45954 RepID=UPI002265336D|nr:uncharacterized protein LOC127832638 isoform X8 [Dreissena polymorpha]
MPFRIYVLVLSGLVGLSGAVEECQFWRGLAQNLSQAREELGKMAAISCNSSCSSIDCTIQMQTGFGSSGNLMFCFGLQLNSCEDPLSMSYYLDVPTVNITMSGKFTHDNEYSVPVPDNLAISNAVKTTAIIKVEMVKVNTTHLKFGVNGILKMSVDFPLVPAFTKSEPVIPPTIIDIEPCRKNGSDTAPSIKIPRKCVSLPPGTGSTPTTAKIVVNSRTFNKSCEFGLLDGTQCSQNEMCAYLGSVSKNAACQCRPLHFLSATTGFCESLMSLTTAKVSDIPNVTQAMSKSGGNTVDTTLSGTGSTPTTAKIVVNSRTFNKSCEFGLLDGTQCSQNEMCAYLGSVSKNAACQCRPLHFLSATTGFCESLMSLTTAKVSDIPNVTQAMSKSGGNTVDTTLSGTGSTPTTAKIVVNSRTFNKSCEFGLLDGTQCSQNEMCAYLGSVSKNAACQCRPLHFLSATTGFCESLMSLTTAKVSDIPNATQAMSKSDGNSVDTKTGMIIGGGVGGLLLIVAVVVFIIIIGRQRRRAMYRNRHALMNDDDDDSLDTNVVI